MHVSVFCAWTSARTHTQLPDNIPRYKGDSGASRLDVYSIRTATAADAWLVFVVHCSGSSRTQKEAIRHHVFDRRAHNKFFFCARIANGSISGDVVAFNTTRYHIWFSLTQSRECYICTMFVQHLQLHTSAQVKSLIPSICMHKNASIQLCKVKIE